MILLPLATLLFAAAPDSIPAHEAFTITSRVLGEPRPINVHLPAGYTAVGTTRFPVLYMPDGGMDEDFPHIVQTVDALVAARVIRPVIIVGIPNTQRRRDLTGPTRFAIDSAIAPRVGGSAAFRQFIRTELFPEVNRRYRTTAERSVIGESLAGLFIVECALTDPALFTHYVALDPSLWWDGASLVDGAPVRIAALDAAPRSLFLSSAGDSDIGVEVARLAAALRATPAPGVTWQYVPRPDLKHATIFRAMEAAALASALR